jgi:hypothetical protein
MQRAIERNVLRIGRNLAAIIVFVATFHLMLAPYYYFRGVILSGNTPSDLWVFEYTILNLSSLVWYSAVPFILIIGFYEVFRMAYLGTKNLVTFEIRNHLES